MTPTDRPTEAPRSAAHLRAVVWAAVRVGLAAVLLGGLGCKSKDGGGGSAAKGSDPLFAGARIPKQNVPVPDRGTAGGPKGRVDPLLGSPTGGTRANSGGGYTDDPDRFKKGPYVPGPGGSPAALAGRVRDDGDGLKIESPGGVPLTPAGGVLTGIASDPAAAATDPVLGELAKYGVKRGDYSVARDGGQVVVRVKVPIGESGPVRSYTGQGATEAAAVKQVVDQIKSEPK